MLDTAVIDEDADLDSDIASKSDEVEILRQLAAAIESGVQDIGQYLRQQAILLPPSAFIGLFTGVFLEKIRKVGGAGTERRRLELISRLCEDFTQIALFNFSLKNIEVMSRDLESGKQLDGVASYGSSSIQTFIAAFNRFLQFLGSPPLRLIDPDILFPMLARTETGSKKITVRRVKRLLDSTGRRKVTWNEVRVQSRRETAWRGESPETIERLVDNLGTFLDRNGQIFGDEARPEFTQAARLALESREFDGGAVKFAAGSFREDFFVADILAALLTCEALAEANVSATMIRYLSRLGGITPSEICNKFGLAPNLIKSLLAECPRYTTQLTPEKALPFATFLSPDGVLFSSYAATTQHMVFEVMPTVREALLGRPSFAKMLGNAIRDIGGSVEALAEALKEKTGQNVKPHNIENWMRDRSLPNKGWRHIVVALDDLLDQDGELLLAWMAGHPAAIYSAYSLHWHRWPGNLKEMHRLVAPNPEGLLENQPQEDGTENDSAEIGLTRFLECFFGYLVNEKGFKLHELSHSLMSDRELIEGFYDFLRKRTGRKTYTNFAAGTSWMLLRLYENVMPVLWPTATLDKHWIKRLLTHAIIPSETAGHEGQIVNLTTPEARWRYHLGQAMESTREFLRTNNFQTERHSRLAWPLIEAGFGVSDVLNVLCRRGEWLPTIILSDQAATESRRLVASILVTMLNMAPSEVRRLGSKHITVSAQGKIQLNIPPSLLNSRRKHSPDILPSELEADEWVHAEIRRYIEQSRPILVGAGKDGGYFLTPGGGDQISRRVLQTDLRLVFGYTAFGQLDLCLVSAKDQGVSDEEIALFRRTTSAAVKKVYENLPPVKGRRANAALKTVQSRTGKDGTNTP
jgi:hypothetical protein